MTKKTIVPIVDFPGSSGARLLSRIKIARNKRDDEIAAVVREVLEEIRTRGDRALFEYARKFDGVELNARNIRISHETIDSRAAAVNPQLKRSIREAAKRIEAYHRKQTVEAFEIKTQEGVLAQLVKPINRVALYVPGGHTVYPSSVLMNAIPARIAGVKEIVAVTPTRGGLDPAIAFALKLTGVKEVYGMGGAQAIGALAYGTASVKAVDKIVGPGNSYVQTAKRLVFGVVDIDSIAGPSEVVIIADRFADPSWVALDLLAQAEHGSGDEIAVCITEDRRVAEKIVQAIAIEIERSPVRSVFEALPAHALSIFVTQSRGQSIGLSNDIAPEHLQIMTRTARKDLKEIVNAGAVFIGNYTPVALGDYFVGTNHVLPTGGGARFSSPLGVHSFLKRISVAEVTPKGLSFAAPFVATFARAEGFVHHALSAERRVVKEPAKTARRKKQR